MWGGGGWEVGLRKVAVARGVKGGDGESGD